MSTNDKHIMMIGLPSTGKTTFLAALWYVVNNTDEVPEALELHSLKGNQEHLNRIQNQWLEYLEVDRTNPALQETVTMELINKNSSQRTEVYFPDISGEEFRQQFEERHCNKDYFKWIENSCGALFFINCGSIERNTTIDELDVLTKRIGGKTASTNTDKEKIVLWEEKLASQQAKLVDLFQIIATADVIKEPFPVAIILSAWDLVRAINNSPKDFFEKSFPLLGQYLKSNQAIFDITHFGISAQGAKLDKNNPELAKELAIKTMIPSSRIIVKTEDDESTDITKPIKWFMDMNYE